MALPRRTYRPAVLAAALLSGLAAVAGAPGEAQADDVSPTGKGITGGGLLGGEVVLVTEALAGTQPGWAYLLGGVAGAGAGAVGGYFVEQGSSDGVAPMYLLAGGMALVIPTVVLVLNATRYVPEEGVTDDKPPLAPGPEADPGSPAGPPPAPAAAPAPAPGPTAAARPPSSVFDVREGAFRLGVPVPDVGPSSVPLADIKRYGIASTGTELRLPVLRVAF